MLVLPAARVRKNGPVESRHCELGADVAPVVETSLRFDEHCIGDAEATLSCSRCALHRHNRSVRQ